MWISPLRLMLSWCRLFTQRFGFCYGFMIVSFAVRDDLNFRFVQYNPEFSSFLCLWVSLFLVHGFLFVVVRFLLCLCLIPVSPVRVILVLCIVFIYLVSPVSVYPSSVFVSPSSWALSCLLPSQCVFCFILIVPVSCALGSVLFPLSKFLDRFLLPYHKGWSSVSYAKGSTQASLSCRPSIMFSLVP